MKVIQLTKDHEAQWDDFVEHHPRATMYHLVGWKTVFESVFNYRSFYLLAMNDRGEIEGILPMFQMADIFQRKYLVSNPFSNFAGVCANTPDTESALVEQAIKIAGEINAQYVEFRQLESRLNHDLPGKDSFVTLMLKLPASSDAVMKSLSSRNRNKIRKAEKSNFETDLGMHYLDEFYDIYGKNLRHLGTPVFPLAMFKAVAQIFASRVELLVLKLNGKPVSGMFLFKFKKMISEPWVASLREYNKIYVNNFLYWQAIDYACRHGFEIFDFGRSTIDAGTYVFKAQWGAEPVPLRYQYHLNKARAIPIVDAVNNKYQIAIDIWKRLPLAFTNFVGPKLVRYLPEL
jgi:FemAB-related protein (PEP-CTERM system-associated)